MKKNPDSPIMIGHVESLSSMKLSNRELGNLFLTDQSAEKPCAHTAMWRAVITQALMDAGNNSKKLEMRKEKARAIAWLNGDGDDFKEVCIMAGLDPQHVKNKAYEAIKNGCKWRVEANRFLQEKRDGKTENRSIKLEVKSLERMVA